MWVLPFVLRKNLDHDCEEPCEGQPRPGLDRDDTTEHIDKCKTCFGGISIISNNNEPGRNETHTHTHQEHMGRRSKSCINKGVRSDAFWRLMELAQK